MSSGGREPETEAELRSMEVTKESVESQMTLFHLQKWVEEDQPEGAGEREERSFDMTAESSAAERRRRLRNGSRRRRKGWWWWLLCVAIGWWKNVVQEKKLMRVVFVLFRSWLGFSFVGCAVSWTGQNMVKHAGRKGVAVFSFGYNYKNNLEI